MIWKLQLRTIPLKSFAKRLEEIDSNMFNKMKKMEANWRDFLSLDLQWKYAHPHTQKREKNGWCENST